MSPYRHYQRQYPQPRYYPYNNHNSARAYLTASNSDYNVDPVEKARLQKALDEFHKINGRDGNIWGYEHSSCLWKEIHRPKRTVGNSGKQKDIAASGLVKAWGYKSPVFCPHRRQSGLPWEPLVIRLSQPHEGEFIDYMKAIDHECSFRTEKFSSHSRINVATKACISGLSFPAVIHILLAELEGTEDEEEDQSPQPSDSSSQSSSRVAASSSQTSVSSGDGGEPSSSSMILFLASKAMVAPLPRYPGMRGTFRIDRQSATAKAFYKRTVADARRISDTNLMDRVHQLVMSGLVKEDPAYHPAWDANNPSTILQVYDQRIYPQCLDRTNSYSDLAYSPIGRGIQDLSSVQGLTFDGYAALVRVSVLCDGCSNSFSPDGYKHHRVNGICTNHHDLLSVSACQESQDAIRLRSYRLDDQGEEIYPDWRGHTQDTAIGAALREWNSRLGVPTDVWILVSTAVVVCEHCDLVRSFAAHTLHLDGSGHCTDPGQAVIAPHADD
ncbi:hypothetical protein C8R45DRAFT_933973 [Mycena sanguinolenta]|nr:hypothetical protein C8R45DRAFT_933973 [Mycena sanguinolenta]